MKLPELGSVRLVGAVNVNPEVRHFSFEVVDAAGIDFVPGQHVRLTKTLSGEPVQRYYSIASAPNGSNRFEICAKVSPSGEGFGRFLAEMEPGEEFEGAGPAGTFRLQEPLRNSVFLAAGTGLAPLRSMLRFLLDHPERSRDLELTLILGTRRPDWDFYLDEFAGLANERPNFSFLHTVSRPGDGWRGRRGYVQSHLEDALADRSREVDVFMCGPGAMMKELARSLVQSGFDIGRVFYEQYG